VAVNEEAFAERHGREPEAVEQRHLVAVEQHRMDDPLLVERNLARRMVIGILIAVPVVAALYIVLVGLALRGSDALGAAPLLMGAGIGAFAALFWGFWFGIAASVREIEEMEHRARRRDRSLDQ
jgi:hypothetical protein